MKYLITFLASLCLLFASIMTSPAQRGGGYPFLGGNNFKPAPPPTSSICTSPPAPHPAQVAGFTKLWQCWDWTTTSQTNSVINGTSGIVNWATMGWLDCAGNTFGPVNGPNVAGASWIRFNGGFNSDLNPCNAVTYGTDPQTNTSALIYTATPAQGAGHLGIATATGDCTNTNIQCYEIFPGGNAYLEINWRYLGTGYNGPVANTDFFSAQIPNQTIGSACMEIDFVEIFGNFGGYFSTGGGYVNNGCGGSSPNGALNQFTLNNNYNTDASLSTADTSSGGTMALCTYHNGVATQTNGFVNAVGGSCNYASGISTPNQFNFLQIWNAPSSGGSVITQNVVLYIAWIRVWSCTGAISTPSNIRTANNSCNTNPVYASPPA